MQLTVTEARVLGALIEKEITTPEYYPLSLNALTAACNQKSSREPVMTLAEDDVRSALRSLEDAELLSIDHGSRVQRYEHRARTVFQLRRDETAILCLLLLRGPQTSGELRSRADRLHTFGDVAAVASALTRMASAGEQRPQPIVVLLPRQPGTKEQRYAHALGNPELLQALPGTPSAAQAVTGLQGRIEQLEANVAALQTALDKLERRVDSIGSA